jgi:MFS family permease
MRAALAMLRSERRARWFFAAHAQSSLGTGAAYVALILLAYDRLASPWAIALVLLADFLPAMLLGPVFGAAADRWSRRTCAVIADLMRAAAFIGLAFVDSLAATVALALVAGAGSALFLPAVMAAIPGLVDRRQVPAATSLYGALTDFGHTAGPALAALALLFVSPETLMVANGASFAVSAVILARLQFGSVRPFDKRGEPRSLLAQAVSGSRTVLAMRGVRAIIVASSAVILCAGMFNVAELLLVREELGAGGATFSMMVGVFGLGVVVGSLAGASGGSVRDFKRRYLLGILATGVGLIGAGLAPHLAVAIAAFALAGLGNGLVLVHERLLLQTSVPDELLGRVFGLKDTGTSWGFAIAFVGAGALLTVLGTREVIVIGGVLSLAVWAAAGWSLRDAWAGPGEEGESAEGLTAERRRRARAPVGAAG